MKNNKIFWIAFFVIIIVAVSGMIILNKKPTLLIASAPEDWSVFKNEKYQYKIAHPESWPVDVRSPEKVSIGQVPYEPSAGAMFILVHPEKNSTYLEEFKKGYPEGCKDTETKMIANLRTWKLVCIESFAGQETNEFFFEHDKDLYHISFISGSIDLNKIFEKVIQTFDFE